MFKKNRKPKESNEMEAPAADPTETKESLSPGSTSQGDAAVVPPEERSPVDVENELSAEDLLEDVRRSLIEEEESDKGKRDAKWWRRIGRKQKTGEPEPPLPPVEIDLPEDLLPTDLAEEQKTDSESEVYEEQINDLIDMLQTEKENLGENGTSLAPEAAEVEVTPEPEPEIDLEQLKEQVFRPRGPGEVQSDSDVRSIALEDGEEVFVEVKAQAADPFEERLKAAENALKPYRSYIYITFAFLGLIMAVIASFLIVNAYQRSKPAPPTPVSNLPYPVAVSLPGGWSFNLGRGTLQSGKWEPNGAEWLEGTEVCRWVSLPWSRQLEAVLRTLNPKDPIELVMSNNDKLTYSVYSVYQMTPEEIHELDEDSPCLLLILTGSDTEKRWVLTALP